MKSHSKKLNRRNFLVKSGLATAAITLSMPGIPNPLSPSPSSSFSTPQSALVFDAMGEIRNVYSSELINKILESGLNAITVTLCDPKSFELEAVDLRYAAIADRPESALTYAEGVPPRPNTEKLLKELAAAEKTIAWTSERMAVIAQREHARQEQAVALHEEAMNG